MRTFKNFSPQQVGAMLVPFKAKQLIAHVLAELTDEQIASAENLLKNLLFKNDTLEGFKDHLDLDFSEGGAGWNKTRADNFSERIGQILIQVDILREGSIDDATKSIMEYLIKTFNLKITEAIKIRISSFLKLRFENKIDSSSLKQRLDVSVKLGGAGLYKQTVDKIAKEVELIMLLKYSA